MTATASIAPARAAGAPPAPVALVAPPAPEGADKSWRKLVTAITAGETGAFALAGKFLTPGTAYELPAGAVVVACDRFPDRREVRMLVAELGGLTETKAWTLKSVLGKRVVDYVARRLPADAARHTAVRLDVSVNRWDSWCRTCRNPVPAGQGRLAGVYGPYERTRVVHHPGQCPPPPPPPEIVRPNRRGEWCLLCGGWVERGEGAARRLTVPEAGGAKYRAVHEGDGCHTSLPGPRNRVTDWCGTCGEPVPPGAGYWFDNELQHAGPCPAPTHPGPTWVVRRRPGEPELAPGAVLRVRVDTRRRGHDLPVTAPGYRMLDEAGYAEMIAVVLDRVTRGRKERARVRPATPDEAAPVLAGELPGLIAAAPHPGGFTARWSAEAFGGRKPRGLEQFSGEPWLAEITGRDPDYGLRREFLRPDRDYSRANSKLTRGVRFWWTLHPNRVYEANYRVSWSRSYRVFLRVTPDGLVNEITREEAEACLNIAAPWPAQ